MLLGGPEDMVVQDNEGGKSWGRGRELSVGLDLGLVSPGPDGRKN